MATLYELLEDRRQALAGIDAAAEAEMAAAYALLLEQVQQVLDELLQAIDAARAAGVAVSPSWLYQSSRYRALIAQLQGQLAVWSSNAALTAAEAQRLALAELGATELLEATIGRPPAGVSVSFATVPLEALNAMIGFTADGTPLANLLARVAVDGVTAARNALVRSIALGKGSTPVARELRDALGIPLLRATTISRTEMHRAYREGVRQSVEANRDLLEGWVWRAAKDARTCAVCWAMDGTLYTFRAESSPSRGSRRVIDIMPTHPRCRCAMVPRAKSYAEILDDPTLPDHRQPIRPGVDRFADLPYAKQREILGPGRHDLYRAGTPLRDMLHLVPDPKWGPMMRLRPFRDLKPPPVAPIDFAAAVADLARRRQQLGISTTAIAHELRIDSVALTRLEAGRATRAEQLRYRIALDRLTHGKAGSLSRAA